MRDSAVALATFAVSNDAAPLTCFQRDDVLKMNTEGSIKYPSVMKDGATVNGAKANGVDVVKRSYKDVQC